MKKTRSRKSRDTVPLSGFCCVQESDGEVLMRMLRRASIDIDVDRINMAGMTALHQVGQKDFIIFCQSMFFPYVFLLASHLMCVLMHF
jgi:hypothetical protein